MITSTIEIAVQHRFAIGQLICSRGAPMDVWRVSGLDYERRYGAVYVLEAVSESTKMWVTTQNPTMPVEEGVQQMTRQYVSFIDVHFVPA